MKNIILSTILLVSPFYLFSQCTGISSSGTHNDCYLNTSKQANINLLSVDSVIAGKWYGDAIGLAYGGTGATTANDALNNLLPSQSGNSGKLLSTDGSNTSWITHVNENITLSGDVTGSGASSITTTLSNTGVSSGSYGIVTVDTKGRVLSGKRQETYSGTTDSNGNYTVTFSNSYSVTPNIQATIVGGSNTNILTVTSISTTGFTIKIENIAYSPGVNPSYSNVNGASVDVLITEK